MRSALASSRTPSPVEARIRSTHRVNRVPDSLTRRLRRPASDSSLFASSGMRSDAELTCRLIRWHQYREEIERIKLSSFEDLDWIAKTECARRRGHSGANGGDSLYRRRRSQTPRN